MLSTTELHRMLLPPWHLPPWQPPCPLHPNRQSNHMSGAAVLASLRGQRAPHRPPHLRTSATATGSAQLLPQRFSMVTAASTARPRPTSGPIKPPPPPTTARCARLRLSCKRHGHAEPGIRAVPHSRTISRPAESCRKHELRVETGKMPGRHHPRGACLLRPLFYQY